MLDRYLLMAMYLRGYPAPPLPVLMGRVHRIVIDADLLESLDDAQGLTAAEIAEHCSITRQAAHVRVQKARETGRWADVLAPKASTTSPAAPARRTDVHSAGAENH